MRYKISFLHLNVLLQGHFWDMVQYFGKEYLALLRLIECKNEPFVVFSLRECRLYVLSECGGMLSFFRYDPVTLENMGLFRHLTPNGMKIHSTKQLFHVKEQKFFIANTDKTCTNYGVFNV